MTRAAVSVEVQQQSALEARERGDTVAEGVALELLSQAFYEDHMYASSRRAEQSAAALAMPNGRADQAVGRAQAQALTAHALRLETTLDHVEVSRGVSEGGSLLLEPKDSDLEHAARAFDRAAVILYDLAGPIKDEDFDAAQAAAASASRARQRLHAGHQHAVSGGSLSAEEVFAGLAAAKVLSPFAEDFAKKLGERLGEATASALSRIRLRRRGSGYPDVLQVEMPDGDQSVVLVLPAGTNNDDAILAAIDLELRSSTATGAVLVWDQVRKSWIDSSGTAAVQGRSLDHE